jgi:cytoskeletal protein CcmA (bactofilin family)
MFKGEKGKSKPESPDRLNRLVAGTKLTGDLTANSSLRVDGEIVGNIECKGKFVLGQDGVVVGNINAAEVEIDGKVEGQINAEVLLILHQTGVVHGDIQTGRIVIEDGAQIEGNIQTGDAGKNSKGMFGKSVNKPNGKKLETSEAVY